MFHRSSSLMKFNPGRSFGEPLSPFSRPYLLMRPMADLSWLAYRLSSYFQCTVGIRHALKTKRRTAPSDSVSTSVFVVSSQLVRILAIEGFALSVCKISSLSSSLSPCKKVGRLVLGLESDTPTQQHPLLGRCRYRSFLPSVHGLRQHPEPT